MPLIKSSSKKAVGKNIEKEMEAGKPKKQSIAIALETQRRARKKMAYGGKAEDTDEPAMPKAKPDDKRLPMSEYMSSKWAEGGKIDDKAERDGNPGLPKAKPDNRRLDEKDYMSDQWAGGSDPERKPDDHRLPMDEYMSDKWAEGGSVVDHIMRKRKMMAEGGEVEGPEHDSENPADMWEEFEEAALKENYSDSGEHEQPHDSNLKGHELSDEDSYDMVDSIRKKMKKRS
jgi:hypothetical protein